MTTFIKNFGKMPLVVLSIVIISITFVLTSCDDDGVKYYYFVKHEFKIPDSINKVVLEKRKIKVGELLSTDDIFGNLKKEIDDFDYKAHKQYSRRVSYLIKEKHITKTEKGQIVPKTTIKKFKLYEKDMNENEMKIFRRLMHNQGLDV